MPKLPFARLAVTLVALGSIAVAGQAAFSASPNVYVVQPGDTLWAIAQRSGVTVGQLAAANGMRPTDILSIGRHLAVPGSSTAAHAVAGSPVPSAAADTAAGGCPPAGSATAAWGVLPPALRASSSRLALRPLFVRWGAAYGVSPALLEAIAWQESGWQQGVVSSAQAVGVGQLLPVTADFVSSQLIGIPLDIRSTNDNIRMMARFVSYLQSEEGGLCHTIAAYYEGPVNLGRYGVLAVSRPYVADVEALLPAFE